MGNRLCSARCGFGHLQQQPFEFFDETSIFAQHRGEGLVHEIVAVAPAVQQAKGHQLLYEGPDAPFAEIIAELLAVIFDQGVFEVVQAKRFKVDAFLPLGLVASVEDQIDHKLQPGILVEVETEHLTDAVSQLIVPTHRFDIACMTRLASSKTGLERRAATRLQKTLAGFLD